ncbi:hypothetical protein CONCODRAFT_70304 [Conidiobolus coronatus NRRL 28638]|uniref:Uncharacterized protein n=1 Tax=Conidiobolus coronatus (strain ATCC 28846 / CBS 209.66 / NRRL 28638) TaxID=796925 RepID=A0A137P7A8_CONC2|nr:hypothetical protein CONCODRAFT_70304 [Conidiobolus coronatus NRRL 28638]|eukprot:KXN70824.1 hypothetical protein CONCODRAFT_70304 [Conidiobolus coronatus NRRL 28638]
MKLLNFLSIVTFLSIGLAIPQHNNDDSGENSSASSDVASISSEIISILAEPISSSGDSVSTHIDSVNSSEQVISFPAESTSSSKNNESEPEYRMLKFGGLNPFGYLPFSFARGFINIDNGATGVERVKTDAHVPIETTNAELQFLGASSSEKVRGKEHSHNTINKVKPFFPPNFDPYD